MSCPYIFSLIIIYYPSNVTFHLSLNIAAAFCYCILPFSITAGCLLYHRLPNTDYRILFSWPRLPVSFHDPLIGGKCFERHGSPCVEFLCADAYFSAQAKLFPIGESC